jgi:hypothetical protein
MKAVFTLPKELEFVSGTGEKGITVTGSGQSASTSPFVLAPKAKPNRHREASLGEQIFAG